MGNFFISLYISLWSSLAYSIVERLPRTRYTAAREYAQFVRYDLNQVYAPNPQAMAHFYQALDALARTRKGKVNIVHFGDSHIQGDHFSDQVRRHFNAEKLFGNGGRGYFFPNSMAQAQNPDNIKVSFTGFWQGCKNVQLGKGCSWGLSGMTAYTNSPLSTFTIDPNLATANAYPIQKVRVYYQVQNSESFYVKVRTSEGDFYPTRLDADGYAEFSLRTPQMRIQFVLEKAFEHQKDFTLEGVSLANEQAGVLYHAVGVNSATVPSFLKCPKLESHLHSLNPDLVIISLGTNDAYGMGFDPAYFKNQMTQLVVKAKKAAPQASILLTTPPDCALFGKPNPMNPKAVEAMREIAREQHCAVWDMFSVMGGLGSVNKWLAQGMAAGDRVHYSAKGYRLQGDLMYDALMNDYAEFHLRK